MSHAPSRRDAPAQASDAPESTSDIPASGARRAPYRLRSARLVLRAYAPTDADDLRVSLARNRPHLLPWIHWAEHEPTSLEVKLERCLEMRAAFDRCEGFSYLLRDPSDGALVGGAGLHLRVGPRAAEIGYWIDAERCGCGLAREAAAAMVRVGFEDLGLERLEIRLDPENGPSRRVAEALGFVPEGILRARFTMPDGSKRDSAVFSLLEGEYPASPARHVTLDRFDALERRLSLPASSAAAPPASSAAATPA